MDKTVSIRIVRSDNKEFKINGANWAIPSNGLEGFGSFEKAISTVDNAVGDGGIITGERIGPKDRTIVCKSRNRSINDILRRAALSFFNPSHTYKVYLTYMGKTVWCEGSLYRFALPNSNIYRDMEMTITFMCSDPYLKSYDNFGKNIASITPMAGFPYMCSITEGTAQGTTGGVFNFAQIVVLENDGDVDTYCVAVFTAKGDVTNPKLIINGNYVRVLDTMAEGDVITVDFTKNPPTVQKNGVNCIGKCDRTSDFDDMQLIVGDSEVAFDADNGTNVLDVTLYYNKLYAAI